MDRRVFLKASASAAAGASGLLSPAIISRPAHAIEILTAEENAPLARLFADRIAALSSDRVTVLMTAPHKPGGVLSEGVTIGTLHTAVARHPGFAFFAGLPGALGMPADVAQRWRETAATDLWRKLQATAGIICLPLGATEGPSGLWSNTPIKTASDIYNRRIVCQGLARDVARGIGAAPLSDGILTRDCIVEGGGFVSDAARRLPEHFACRSGPAITRVASPRAIMLPAAHWRMLPCEVRDIIHLAATQLEMRAPPRPARNASSALPARAFDPAFIATIDRVAEAVVADMSGSDRLTRRINAAYFAAQPSTSHAGVKNVV